MTAMHDNAFSDIEVGTLYAIVIISCSNGPCTYGLFLPTEKPDEASGAHGFLWMVSQEADTGIWSLQVSEFTLERIILLVRLASVSENGDGDLEEVARNITEIVGRVEVSPNAQKNVHWMIDAVGELHDGAWLECSMPLFLGKDIRTEAENAAKRAIMMTDSDDDECCMITVLQSSYCSNY